MRFDLLTLFPGAFEGPLDVSILARAQARGLFSIHLTDIRDFATDRHRSVDDYPFGGGPGMVMRVDVLDAALDSAIALDEEKPLVVAMTPQGERLDDGLVRELARQRRLIIVCGRYEGMDERFLEHRVDRQISIGDFVLTGGELAAMVLVDAVARHVPGVLGDDESPEDESFADGLLEYPQYTRPADYRGWSVPEVLLGGNHADIESWRREQRVLRTRERRPDLLERAAPPELPLQPSRKPARVAVRGITWPDDLSAVRALWSEASGGLVLGASDSEGELAKLDRELFLVAEVRGAVAGSIIGGFDGRRGYAYHLAVAKRMRGRRVAAALLTELEGRLRARGCRRMNVHVVPGTWGAIRFWERQGWERLSLNVYSHDLDND